MYGIMLVVILILTGGVIAFIGDRLGTKVGKKKLSLFGLRPRHTSVVVTIITGIMITTITFTILSITSENVRLALFGMEKLQKQITQTQQALDEKNNTLTKTTEDLAKIKKEYNSSKKELVLLSEDLARSQEKSRRLLAEQAQLTRLNSSLHATNRDLSEKNTFLEAHNNSLKLINNKLDTENDRLENTNRNLRESIESIKERPIVYRVGELLATATMEPTKEEEVAEAKVENLVNLANNKIIATLGADTKSRVLIYPDEYKKAITHILENKTGTVVRLVVSANMVNGDPVLTNLETYPYRLVYPAHTLIYQNYYTVDEHTDYEILMGDFLRGVNRAAVKEGILPNPLTGMVGALSGSQVMELEDVLTKTKGRILLQAYAEGNTSIIDPLRLDIVIKQ